MPKFVMLPPLDALRREWAERLAAALPDLDVVVAEDDDAAARELVDADCAYGWVPPQVLPTVQKLTWLQNPDAGPFVGYYYKELIDSIYFTVFPNFHPWGSFNRIVYRFRPHGSNPEECIHECMVFAPAPDAEKRPPAAPIHWLGPDDDWVDAPELGMLAKVFNQDVFNLPRVQRGLKAAKQPFVLFGDYGESKLRHFHALLEEWIAKP